MQKIANLRDLERGKSLTFNYKGKKAILVRTKDDKLVAYIAICPHEQGNIEWDEEINKFLCECHLSLFNVGDGSVYAHSSLFELNEGLTKVDLKVDEKGDIYAL